MNYTLHQLRVLLKVIEAGSITKAAESLHLSQPAVSIQIKKLQDQFEIPLMEVIGRKIFITDFGKEIGESAQKIINEVDVIDSKAAAHKGRLTGRLKITVVSTGKYVIPSFLSDFMKQHQGIELVLDVTNRARVVESLMRNEVDFALVSVLPEQLQVEEIKLMENELFLVGSNKISLSGNEEEESILQQVPLIFREKGSGTRNTLEMFLRDKKFSVKKKMELTSNEAVKQAVMADLGYAVMPLIGIRNELEKGDLQIIPVKDFPIKSTWRLIWLNNKRLSPVAEVYRQYILQEKETLIKEKFGDVQFSDSAQVERTVET